jgi:hypothetical protein
MNPSLIRTSLISAANDLAFLGLHSAERWRGARSSVKLNLTALISTKTRQNCDFVLLFNRQTQDCFWQSTYPATTVIAGCMWGENWTG